MWIYQIGTAERAFEILSERLRTYIQERQGGHTKEFLFASLTNTSQRNPNSESDLRVLLKNQPWLPASWLKKSDSGTFTNKAGISSVTTFVNGKSQTTTRTNLLAVDEVCRWVSYVATDGDIAWRYMLNFKANGQLDNIYVTKRDAKEEDVRFRKTIKDVEDEVRAEMKKNGSFGKLGSVHTFWRLKREKLKAKEIEWRSPAELNPGTNYD